jgi:cell wall-associated NlpC family hydrolase
VKRKLRFAFVIAITIAMSTAVARGTQEQEESFGDKLKKLFVRPTPTPKHRKKKKTSPTPIEIPVQTPTPTETPVSRPRPSLSPMIKPSLSRSVKKAATPNAAIAIADISDSQSYSPEVRKIIDLGLNLTAQNLAYKYASADPSKGGMDGSGFIYYLLSKFGIKDVPRDAREQYVWVRKAGTFEAVLAQRDDSFELDALKPGDLLFWVTPYSVSRDPDVIQTMIYIGRDKTTNQRLMVGASEGRTYKGQMRKGVGVFDFKIGRTASKAGKEPAAVFVGYGHIPGLGGK